MKKKKSFKKLLIFSIIIMLIGFGLLIYANTDTHQVEIITGVYKSEANGSALGLGAFAIVIGIVGIIASFILKTSVNKVDSIKENKQKKADEEDALDTLKELKERLDNGRITQEEYDKKKAILMERL